MITIHDEVHLLSRRNAYVRNTQLVLTPQNAVFTELLYAIVDILVYIGDNGVAVGHVEVYLTVYVE